MPFLVVAAVITHRLCAGHARWHLLAVAFIVLLVVSVVWPRVGHAHAPSAVPTLVFFVNLQMLFCSSR